MAYGVWPARGARFMAYCVWLAVLDDYKPGAHKPSAISHMPSAISYTLSAIRQLLSQCRLERVDLFTQGFSFFFEFLQFLRRNVRLLFGNEDTRDSFKSGT